MPLDDLTRLAVAEQRCCSFFSFAVTVDNRGLAPEVRAPADAENLIGALFGAASARAADVPQRERYTTDRWRMSSTITVWAGSSISYSTRHSRPIRAL